MNSPAPWRTLLSWLSWVLLVAAALAAATAFFSRWAINAPSLGAHDAGLAIFFSFVSAFALIGATYAAPVLALAGLGTLLLHRAAGLRMLAAAAAAGLPIALLTLMERV